MSSQMTKIWYTRAKGSVYPLWGWVQYEGVKLSPLKTYSEMVDEGVLLTVEIDDGELLKSDFDLWSAVLSNNHIPPANNPDMDINIANKDELEKSWECVFDLDNHYRDFSVNKSEQTIQACYWRLDLKHVISAEVIQPLVNSGA